MDTNSSGEDLLIKARKPYTITKQREKWTEEEHNKFLEALKLYGRAWQRIEEHIGTKTAVQIRSHAQKFFTKLEKEAATKGVPFGHALDIEIPPPRPKRKPSCPYPRKNAVTEEQTVEETRTKTSSPLSGTVNSDKSCSEVHNPSIQHPQSYQSISNMSSTLSSLIVSSLVQHPAVHAAATVAASYWPSDATSSEAGHTAPTMAAVAAATVAAASAWWATLGLLPLYPPVHARSTYAPPPTASVPVVHNSEEKTDEVNDGETKVGRSSCGSNTPSSSEGVNLLMDSNRRIKGIVNESWKEVSEEGRIAFRALFTRGALPQSFSPPQESMVAPPSSNDREPPLTKPTVDINQKASSESTDPYYTQALCIASRKTGFKPYKRCSFEAKEIIANTNEENSNKRIRLEGEASI